MIGAMEREREREFIRIVNSYVSLSIVRQRLVEGDEIDRKFLKRQYSLKVSRDVIVTDVISEIAASLPGSHLAS